MIVQEINLYQDRFKEKKIWLPASHLFLLCGLMALILGFSSDWYHSQYRQAEQLNRIYQQKKEQSTRLLEAQQKKLHELLENNQVDRKISKISTDIAVRKRIINFVTNNQFGSGKGFSSHLSNLSEINVSDVWLNEISLAEDYLKLSGSSLKAEKIPEYFNLFRQRQLFDGQVFEIFQLDRVQDQDWKVDFLIASRAATDE